MNIIIKKLSLLNLMKWSYKMEEKVKKPYDDDKLYFYKDVK